MQYRPYVPQNVGELLDKLGSMMLGAPTFKDKTGYFSQRNIDTEFLALNEGLQAVRKKLGEERYATLRALSDRMRALFEADPGDKTGDTQAGREIIHEMEDVLRSTGKQRRPK
jgi:hypothetical protein